MIEIVGGGSSELNFRQRWAGYLTIAITLLALLGGALWRTRLINATTVFQDTQNGITARYPTNWLLDQRDTGENTVFRVQDPASLPFKTTLQVSLQPSGPQTRANDVIDQLNISRASQFSAYRRLDTQPYTLPNGNSALLMNYAYVAEEPNPFLQSIPIVVRGIDIVVLSSQQAIIITYRADADSFDRDYHYFDAFIRGLAF